MANDNSNKSLNDIVGVKDGTKIYNQIIYQSFEKNEDRGLNDYMDKKDEIVDVVTGYNWSIDSMATNADSNTTNPETANKIAHVPHCYAIEYQQRYSSSMTNLINSLVGINVGASNLVDTAQAITTNLTNFLSHLSGADVTGTVQSVKDSVTSAIGNLTGVQPQTQTQGQPQGQGNGNESPKYIGDIMNYVKDTFSNYVKTISNPLKAVSDGDQNHYLQPYSLLYDMTSTGLKYCFPMISNPPVIKASNSYADSQDETSILSANSLFSKISSFASSIASFNRDLSQFNAMLSGTTDGSIYERTNVEKAKFFQYPTQTDSYTITFPLFNTVKSSSKSPIWTKNYKFILLFCMRNMIFRKDNTSFFPPLFYDLTIPGVIRQPFTYVESVNVQPQGMVRMLSCKELFSFMVDKKMSVPVPEAWIVTITFKSLIPTSANLVLSALDDSIVTAISQ